MAAMCVASLSIGATMIAPSQADTDRFESLANSPFKQNRPTPGTAKTLAEELVFQRATQTYLWAIPLLNTMGMRDSFAASYSPTYNTMAIWEKRLDARTLITTPNSDLIYGTRAAIARSNIYVNRPEETRYFYMDVDSEGQLLNGADHYTVTFKTLPPVNGFWSLTVYNEQHLFERNALNRYSLGTKSKSLKRNTDGTPTLYVQAESPGLDKESNWIPTPKGKLSLYQPNYWPKQEIIQGKWTPPGVVKAS